MRIIAGKYKGRRLQVGKGLPVRPTTDRTRESLFNILNAYYSPSQKQVLDLFCGTGIVSGEFMSRGAAHVTGVDRHRGSVQSFNQVMRQLEEQHHSRGISSDCLKFCRKTEQQWDIIFMDPPYAYPHIQELVQTIFRRNLLSSGGICIVEHDPHLPTQGWTHFDFQKTYGSSAISFFKHEDGKPGDT